MDLFAREARHHAGREAHSSPKAAPKVDKNGDRDGAPHRRLTVLSRYPDKPDRLSRQAEANSEFPPHSVLTSWGSQGVRIRVLRSPPRTLRGAILGLEGLF